tara:strand:- start:930 stop:2834 length:1905 start_codon:yes stop_codon:yes gene_type:complete
MGGGLMQLVAYGAQDVYLTGNPQITFWKVTYRRHTNFAMESIEQTFNGQADFGRRVTCTLARNGDLAYRTYFQVTLPEINQQMRNPDTVTPAGTAGSTQTGVYARWLDCPGEQMIAQVEVEIGGQRIDRQYGDWMHIWNQLTLSSEQQRGYHQMIGQTTNLTYLTDPTFADVDGPCDSNAPRNVCAPRNALPETTLYVPLQFWYCRNPGLALPLIALQYHEVRINLDIRPIDECLWAVSNLDCKNPQTQGGNLSGSGGNSEYNLYSTGASVDAAFASRNPNYDVSGTQSFIKGTRVNTAYSQSLVAASLYVDYVFLDTDERRRMAQNPHEYLIEQLQFTGDESVGSSSNKIKLNFNHPCKEIIWVVQPDSNVDYCSSLECGNLLWNAMGAQPFNYTDTVDALPPALHAFAGPDSIGGGANSYLDHSGLFFDSGAADISPEELQYWGGTQKANGLNGPPGTHPPQNTDTQGSLGKDGGGRQRTNSDYTSPNLGDHHPGYDPYLSAVSDAGSFVLSETALNMHCWGENPVVTAKLQLNGQDRFSEREGTYFDLVQPYQHHTRNPDTGINVYSFALRPEEHQPSGSCNFSRIDNATLQLVLSNATVEGTKTAKVRVYATNYNVLRVMSGMGGLAYSN